MGAFRDRPIAQKLVIITSVTMFVALLLAAIGIITADSFLCRGYLRRDLTALARIIADNSTAAIAFNDPEAATQTLGALRERSHVAGACMFRADQTVLARYTRDANFSCPAVSPSEVIQFAGMTLSLSEPVMLNHRRIGTLVFSYDLGEIDERIRLYGATVFVVFLISSFIAFLLSSRLRETIAAPIAGLVRATRSVAETGDYRIRAEKISGDELGVLVDRFNEMLAAIESRDEELKKAFNEVEDERARFHFLAESMPQKIFTATADGHVDYRNGQWAEFTGIPVEQLLGSNWTQFTHPDDLEETGRQWEHSIATGAPFLGEQRFRRHDGKYRWHLTRAHPMRDHGGEITMWIGSNTDIHEQKEKEQELRRANEDLEQFAYSASHDLQEPIRNVAVYSEIVAKRYSHVVDDQGKQFLEFLREGGHRLATLVNDLLAYTRASMAELSEKPVSAAEALENCLANLAEALRESSAEVTSDPLPEVFMGDAHLQQVLQNLISNALKYRSEQAPRIHVSASKMGGMWCFSVKDNGIGIDPRYKEKIFGVFKRLHHDRKYSGTGIGLAICQRVVERYGGRIWVESEPSKGATFFFTIPQYAQPARSATVQSSPG
jgi:PAS domain S-box-containing protein